MLWVDALGRARVAGPRTDGPAWPWAVVVLTSVPGDIDDAQAVELFAGCVDCSRLRGPRLKIDWSRLGAG